MKNGKKEKTVSDSTCLANENPQGYHCWKQMNR